VSPLLWVDGLIGGLAVAAVGAAVLFTAVLACTDGPPATVATNLAYPLGDLVILTLVVGTLVATGRAAVSAWAWIAAGLLVFSVSDALFLMATAEGGYVHGALFDAGWNAGSLAIAVAAWRPAHRVEVAPVEGWRTIALPIGFALVSLDVLVLDHFARTNPVALALAVASLLAVLARLVLTFADNVHMLRASRQEACTDSLTGLANRRRLTLDLARVLRDAADERRLGLTLFDLDGFKQYNDNFGHPAGDALLARLGRKLAAAVGERGSAYRMGGTSSACWRADGRRGQPRRRRGRRRSPVRAGRELLPRLLARHGRPSPRGPEPGGGAADRRPAHVPPQVRAPRHSEPADHLRLAPGAQRAPPGARRARPRRRRPGRGHGPPPRGRGGGARAHAPRGPAPRHREDGGSGRDPRQARPALRERVDVREAPPPDRRADCIGGPGAPRRRPARALEPRALRWRRLPGWLGGRGDPLRGAGHLRLRRARRDGLRSSLPGGDEPHEALEELRRCAGTRFDPEVVEALRAVAVERAGAVGEDQVASALGGRSRRSREGGTDFGSERTVA
jgi:hypothetical protein